MTLDEILSSLDRIAQLETDLRVIRSAPPPLAEHLARAEAESERAAAAFRARPFHFGSPLSEAALRHTLLGMVAVIAPKISQQLIEAQVRATVQADPREPLDAASRAARSTAVETEIVDHVGRLSWDDLHSLKSAVDAAHGAYRGLAERLAQAEERGARRAADIAAVQDQRFAIWHPPPLPGLAMAGDLSPPAAPRPPPSAAEREAAQKAVEQQLEGERQELLRDQAVAAALKTEATAASERWRVLAQTANQLERLLLLNRAPPAAA